MQKYNKISTIIIDDDKEAIFTLQNYLDLISHVEVLGTATTWQKAIRLIRETEPELIFLDIEMPGKTGFELLAEAERQGISKSFKVIFHTAYDKYTIRALREAAFDFILKPPAEEEIKEVIHRFQKQRNQPSDKKNKPYGKLLHEMVALPTHTGLQFLPKADIVFIECQKSALNLRPAWVVSLNNGQMIKLRPSTNANSILEYLGSIHFVAISQSVIVNISYICMVEYKSSLCFLFPPFDQRNLKISRQFLTTLRERFEVI
jgi:DNA-binding LytR/AlgR family response regulator